jgi:hypothetical protein
MNKNLMKALLVLVASTPMLVMAHGSGKGAMAKGSQHEDDRGVGAPQTFQAVDMADISKGAPFSPAQGAAFLVRSKNTLQARVMLADLVAGDAYTVWWFVFNNPSACSTHPCTPGPDFGPGDAAVFFGTGVIGAAGNTGGVVNATFETSAGGPPSGAVVIPDLPEKGLRPGRGFAAEVHLLMIDHGTPEAPTRPDGWQGWPVELSTPIDPGIADVRGAFFAPSAP